MPSLRFLQNVTILKAIAHHLDHLTPEKIISTRMLKITEAIHLYLAEHVIAVSKSAAAVPCRFFDDPGDVAMACRITIAYPDKFTKLSAQIAERLFRVMGSNKSLSPGLLLVLLARDNDSQQTFVAILKMEAQPVFAEDRQQGEDGHRFIELAINPANLPAPGRHIQKCALVKSNHTDAEPEILMIDKQARDAAVAGFFHEHFLQAEYCRDSHFRTKKFIREFVKWANKAQKEHRMTPEELGETVAAARDAVRNSKLSVPEFVEKNISNRGEQSDCMETLTTRSVDAKFITEAKASEKFRRTTEIKVDHSAQIRMTQRAMLDGEFYKVEQDPEDQSLSIITIRTRKYQVS